MNNKKSAPFQKATGLKSFSRSVILLLLVGCSFFLVQCKKESTTTSSSAKLAFSANLLFFDTVFTTVGSTDRVFVVHNNNSQAVVVSNISLKGLWPTYYKINVDGVAGSNFNNIKIPANDSIYVFATVTVDPQNTNNPAVIRDSLVFTTNGNLQSVALVAFGWNAYFYVPDSLPRNGVAYYQLPGNSEWKNDKPHVIFGYLHVPTGITLTMDAGCQVYLHDSAVIYVDSAATLNVMGTPGNGNQVTFQGDRLEPDYKYLPGQWNSILLYKSTNCNISWAVIQNGQVGIQVDTLANGGTGLKMDHTIIKSMSEYGLFGAGTNITADDCLIADCQNSCLYLWIGGTYIFNQCTFADYWGVYNGYSQRSSPLLYINNYYESATSQIIQRPIHKAYFGNCIIYGALNEELKLDSLPGYPADSFKFFFQNCLIKTQQSTTSGYHYNGNILNQDPGFNDVPLDLYLVANPGPAIGVGNPNIAVNYTLTLDDEFRNPTQANLGAYEQ
jgi:hypothetical protein